MPESKEQYSMLKMREYIIKWAENGSVLNHREKAWSDNLEENVSFDSDDRLSANDYIAAIKLGFHIAKRGYEKITVVKEPWQEV